MICTVCATAADQHAPADQHCADPRCTCQHRTCQHRTDRYQPASGSAAAADDTEN